MGISEEADAADSSLLSVKLEFSEVTRNEVAEFARQTQELAERFKAQARTGIATPSLYALCVMLLKDACGSGIRNQGDLTFLTHFQGQVLLLHLRLCCPQA